MSYVFDPEVLGACVQAGVGLPPEEAMDAITLALRERYPEQISAAPRNWIFNNAGGAMGQIALMYCSLSEYLLFFGTPIGTEGHSGRYATEVYDWVFNGEMWCYLEGQVDRVNYRDGELAYLGRNHVKGYRIPDSAWMLEYSRGPIPTMLPFGLADTLMSTLDVWNMGRTLGNYGKLVAGSLMRGEL